MSDDDVRRALDTLARRADRYGGPDRVAAVHRRARRTAVRRTGACALAVAGVMAGGLALAPSSPWALRDSGPARAPEVVVPRVAFTADQVTDPAVVDAIGAAFYGKGVRIVVVEVRISGTVPAAGDGSPFSLYAEQPGLGSQGNDTAGPCRPGAPLVPVDARELVTFQYGPGVPSGPAEVVVTVGGCSPVQAVTRRVVVTVPAG